MSARRPIWIVAALVLGSTPASGEEPSPELRLRFSYQRCSLWSQQGLPGTPVSREVECLLTTPEVPTGGGVAGWSIAVAVEGMTIGDHGFATTAAAPAPAGHLTDGFATVQVSTGCGGREVLTSAVLLSQSSEVTLPERSSRLLRFELEGSFPGRDQETPVRLEFVDGCQVEGSGAAGSSVIWSGVEVAPMLESCEFSLGGPPSCPLRDAPLQIIFQTRNRGETSELFAAVAPSPEPYEPAELTLPAGRRSRVWAGIVSRLSEPGVQGWGLSIGLEGDAHLAGADTAGTAGDEASRHPHGRRRGTSFEVTEVVDPDRDSLAGGGGPQGEGVISAVVLSFAAEATLLAAGTATVLGLDLEGEKGATGLLRCKDGLRESGGSVRNETVVHGSSRDFDCCQWVKLEFEESQDAAFHRGDANDDGRFDLSDALRILGVLFLGEATFGCRDAADANDDGRVDVSDAVALLGFLFLGGPPPGFPGPPGRPCGADPPPHTREGCREYSSC